MVEGFGGVGGGVVRRLNFYLEREMCEEMVEGFRLEKISEEKRRKICVSICVYFVFI